MMFFKVILKLDYLRSSFILLLFCFLACGTAEHDAQYEWSGLTMGTSYQVKVTGIHIDKDKKHIIATQIDSSLKSVNAQMSTYDPMSEISLFNKNLQTVPVKISQPFYKVLETAMDISHQSGGAFDITVGPLVNLWGFGPGKVDKKMPVDTEIKKALSVIGFQNLVLSDGEYISKTIPNVQIDLSAIAKGYGVDVIADLMENYNFKNYMVEVGGEVRVKGVNASNECWKIGIDKPKHASIPGQQLQEILCLNDVAVATSGDYRNYFFNNGKYYSHTIDPVSGYPVNHNLASVTIITLSCMLADGLATATMVLGPEKGLEWIEGMTNVEAMLIERIDENNFDVKYTKGFKKYLLND